MEDSFFARVLFIGIVILGLIVIDAFLSTKIGIFILSVAIVIFSFILFGSIISYFLKGGKDD